MTIRSANQSAFGIHKDVRTKSLLFLKASVGRLRKRLRLLRKLRPVKQGKKVAKLYKPEETKSKLVNVRELSYRWQELVRSQGEYRHR